GSLSDRVGRRAVTGLGFACISVGIMLYGVAPNVWGLLLARCVYAVGIAAVSTMLITLMADYAQNASRGRATGYLGIMNGLGAMTAALFLLRLPDMFQGAGFDASGAAIATYGTMAGITGAVALVMFLGLRPGLPANHEDKPPLLTQLREGVTAAREPLIALAYAASFVARGNLAVVGTFFTLWGTLYGTGVLGMDTAAAVAKSGGVVAISYAASLFSAPLFGWMSDRFHRVTALAVTLFIGAVGYGSTGFIENPFGGPAIVSLILIGMAEVGCIITSGVLIAEQAPERLRGSVVGIFTLSGAVGILIASVVGGYLFDHWIKPGPFVFFGAVSALVLLWALVLRARGVATPAADAVTES
ncbi:MAG: MFS transporter, partial [Pseudomonadota bacterium]